MTEDEIIDILQEELFEDESGLNGIGAAARRIMKGINAAQQSVQRTADGAGDFSGFRALIHQALEQFEKYRRR